ncbi:ectoine/hydroxyectoine ABC transporter permease subunit EhuD [Breoghania sp.]|uniref:ectoine/hydroxyectoine ABC transporter permease subunit EhuD n=1 Tax=Breoghania sp. TaxID=2065378 RepID=UPI00262D5F03|nr:ectoine/hydroxyectoine ABC transporter permease subunit EhuD [Breoghania sp.]MDJ0931873.1 ectoine/hydroxyectoine ABC transporter permease subunit EhuD [Breoghania sp.]
MEWDWDFVWKIMPTLIGGVKITIIATLLGSVLSTVVGLAVALLRRSAVPDVSRGVGFVAEFIRGTPLLVQLYLIFYVLPDFGILPPPLLAGVIGLGLNYGTYYTAEVYRAGIDNVPRGQWEAAKACNLTGRQTCTHVILPQAIPPMIPALANYFIAMFKETPLLSVITVLGLMNQAKSVVNSYYRYIEPMTLVGVFFLTISLLSVFGLRWLERRYGRIESGRVRRIVAR